MRLGFDLDGTVADLHGALAREAAGMFQTSTPQVCRNPSPRLLNR
jgi:hypothetical protein